MQFFDLIGHNLTLHLEFQYHKRYCNKTGILAYATKMDSRSMLVLFLIYQYL